jgi:hypothetical protein
MPQLRGDSDRLTDHEPKDQLGHLAQLGRKQL